MKTLITLILVFASYFAIAQKTVYTSDIDNFWIAYDRIKGVNNYSEKIKLINDLYINKGTNGLKAFMESRNYSDTLWIKQIEELPKFWESIRANTLKVKDNVGEIEKVITNFKKLYPTLKAAEIYFTIGGLKSGGTIKENMVLIGSEIASGDKSVDLSEFKDDWLKNVFTKEPIDIVALNIHEYVHTQQKPSIKQVLAHSIHEGACDFIAELVTGKPLITNYLTYGKQHSEEIKKAFKKEMFTGEFDNWLYNGTTSNTVPDLGYYVGYEICKAYYDSALDKKTAIKHIIELDVADEKELETFLKNSGYFKEAIHKKQLLKAYEANLPYVKNIMPFKNGDNKVSSDLKILKIVFSKEMDSKVSINFSKNGKEHFPLKKIIGFENNHKTLLLELDLKPKTEYDFYITNRSTKSKGGYKLKTEDFKIGFTTK